MYQLTHVNTIYRTTDAVFIPVDLGNADYQQYLSWRKNGNTPLPADEPDARALAKAKIAELEAIQIKETARFIRETTLKDAEDKALAEFGIDPAALYAMGEGSGAPPPILMHFSTVK